MNSNVLNTFKYLVSGYFGIRDMDEYDLKNYVLKEIEDYIKDYLSDKTYDFDPYLVSQEVEDNYSKIEKLNDSLIVLRKINGSMELILMIKHKIKDLKYEELRNNNKS